MSATWSESIMPALFAGQNHAKRMPFSTHTMSMTTASGSMIIRTGALASVSLFVLPHILNITLLASLVLLLSLTLIGLTRLRGLVRLTVGLELNKAQGD